MPNLELPVIRRGLRRVAWPLLFAVAFVGSGCRHDESFRASCCIDLLQELPHAEIRPVNLPPDAVRLVDRDVNGKMVRALFTVVPTRVVIYPLHIPRRAVLTAWIGVEANGSYEPDAGVAFRLGIADDRTYEQLVDQSILASSASSSPSSTSWTPVRVDLSRYAGWQWSLFYHPSSISWTITINTYPIGRASGTMRGVWAAPVIEGRE